jgi:hypothetical protein
MLSDKEKKFRQHEKELKSFRNKMGSNIVWFDSLSLTKKYDILFQWKKIKKTKNQDKPVYITVKKRVPIDPNIPWGRKKIVEEKVLKYPPSLKHFIKMCREMRHFQPNVVKVRESAIELILNNK